MKTVHRLLFAMHVFVGIGALGGGLAAITNPHDPLGVPSELLKNSPFNDFFIPGIILFTLLGIGNLLSAFMFRYKSKYQGYISSIFGWALVIWIVVQCIMLDTVHFLHVIFFLIGLVKSGLALVMLFEKPLFPEHVCGLKMLLQRSRRS